MIGRHSRLPSNQWFLSYSPKQFWQEIQIRGLRELNDLYSSVQLSSLNFSIYSTLYHKQTSLNCKPVMILHMDAIFWSGMRSPWIWNNFPKSVIDEYVTFCYGAQEITAIWCHFTVTLPSVGGTEKKRMKKKKLLLSKTYRRVACV